MRHKPRDHTEHHEHTGNTQVTEGTGRTVVPAREQTRGEHDDKRDQRPPRPDNRRQRVQPMPRTTIKRRALPNAHSPAALAPGTLEFSQEAISLDLLGRFDEQSSSFFPLPRPRILGDVEGNKLLTLECCGAGGASIGGLVSTKYIPNTVLVGAHYEPGEQVSFDKVAIHFDELDVWAATSGLSREITTKEDEAGEMALKAIDVHFEPPPAVELKIARGVRLSLEFGWQYDDKTPLKPEVQIRQRAGLVLRFDERVSLLAGGEGRR
jgi:ApeA N-terminal domain 1